MFTVFGSESSQDLDVIVFVEEIPEDPSEGNEMCKFYNQSVGDIYENMYGITKEVNCNLAVLKGGYVVQVHKGTSDEVNNALVLTREFHTQFHKNEYVRGLVKRELQIKLLRTARVLLSFVSRTSHRPSVKAALRGDVYHKLRLLREIDLGDIKELGKTKVTFEDYLKTMAFQLGQTIGLSEGVELYTKESISETYPLLGSFLNRDTTSDLNILNMFKEEFCDICDKFEFTESYEYKI
jgi:hypothetical protein